MTSGESKYVTVDGVKLHYQEQGDGYPVVCIHGAGPGSFSAMAFAANVSGHIKAAAKASDASQAREARQGSRSRETREADQAGEARE